LIDYVIFYEVVTTATRLRETMRPHYFRATPRRSTEMERSQGRTVSVASQL